MTKPFLSKLPDQATLESSLAQLDWLDGHHDEMVQLMIRLSNLNSGTFNLDGLKAVRDILTDEFSSLGGNLDIVEIDPLKSVNDQGEPTNVPLGKLIHIQKRRPGCPTALLCIHMDTVYPIESEFQTCEYLPDGRIMGPGVADAKGGLVVMLFALKALEASALADKLGWEVIINPDEEVGSPGSERFLVQRAQQADFGLLFEPALPNGNLVAARKGGGNFTFVVRGKSAHSGRDFEQGRNAIVCCCQIMTEIHAFNDDSDIIFNVGKISGGEALNVVPDLAIGRVNVRVSTHEQIQVVHDRFNEIAERFSQRDGFQVALHGRFTQPPKVMTPEIESLQSLIVECGKVLGQKIQWQNTGGASDGNKFAAAGLPNVDSLGPLGGAIHSSSEYMFPDSLLTKVKHSALILMSAANCLYLAD